MTLFGRSTLTAEQKLLIEDLIEQHMRGSVTDEAFLGILIDAGASAHRAGQALRRAVELGSVQETEARMTATEGPDSIILRYLRRIDEKQDRMAERLDALTQRMQAVELGIADIRRDLVRLDHRMDGFEARLERIERRLELREPADA